MRGSAVEERVAQLLESAPLLYALAKGALLARGRFPDRCEDLIPPPSGLDLDGTSVAAALDDELGLLTPILVEANSWEWTPGRDCSALLLAHADRFSSAVRTIVEAPAAQWWWEPLRRDGQIWLNPWDDDPPIPFEVDFADGFTDDTTPRDAFWTSTRIGHLPGVSLFFAWDGLVKPPIAVWSMPVDTDARIFEIRSSGDWIALCSRYPRDTTGLHGGRWRRDFDIDGTRVVTPAWELVAEDWDGIHMGFAGLLGTTCRQLNLDRATTTSVMRWHTECTAWFHPVFGRPVRAPDWPGPLPYPG